MLADCQHMIEDGLLLEDAESFDALGPNTQSPLGAPIPPRNSWQGISADMDLHYVRSLYDQPSDSRNHFALGPSAASICPKRLRTLSGSPMLVAASRAYRYASLASRLVIS